MDVIKKKHWWQSDALKWSVLGLLGLLVGYLVVLMYAQGEYLFAITTLILSSAGLYIFANRKAYAWRYVYPEWLEWDYSSSSLWSAPSPLPSPTTAALTS